MSLQKLHSLVHQFNTHELTLIRYALKGSKDESGENKYLRLFEYVIKEHKTVSRKAASMVIYHAVPDTRITKLAERLEEKILDIIISDGFLRKSNRVPQDSLASILTQKRFIQASVIKKQNGSSHFFNRMLDGIIEYSERAGNVRGLVELYIYKRAGTVFNGKENEYRFYDEKVKYFRKCYEYEQKSAEYYYEVIKEQGFGTPESDLEKIKLLRRWISVLIRNKKYLFSPYARFNLGKLQIEYLLLQSKYRQAQRIIVEILKDLNKTVIAGTPRIKMIESELGNCDIFLGNYKSAIKYFASIVSSFKPLNKLNYFVALTTLFYPTFYDKQLSSAERIIDELLSDENPIRNQFRFARTKYFRACVYFQKTEFRETLKIINSPSPLNKDKTGYDIAIRVLRIQSLLELEREDEVATQVENLRKHISRNYKKTYVSDRDKMIIRVLQQMARRGFSGKSYKLESEMIQKLSLSKSSVKWMPLTPELIRFHEWYTDWQSRKSKGILS